MSVEADNFSTIFRAHENGIDLFVRLTPNASKETVSGIHRGEQGDRLAVKVRAVPEKGKANKALEKFMAKKMGVPKSSTQVTQGTTHRLKTLTFSGESTLLTSKLIGLLDQFSGDNS